MSELVPTGAPARARASSSKKRKRWTHRPSDGICISRRGDGGYEGDILFADGSKCRRRVSARNEREARTVLRLYKEEVIAKGGLAKVKPESATTATVPRLRDFEKNFLEHQRDRERRGMLAPSTLRQHEQAVPRIMELLGDCTANELTSSRRCRQFVRDLAATPRKWSKKDQKIASNTVRNRFFTARALIDTLRAEEWMTLPENPLRRPEVVDELPPAVAVAGRGVVVLLPPQDLPALLALEEEDEVYRALFAVGALAGLRVDEAGGLTVADLRIDEVEVPHLVVRMQLDKDAKSKLVSRDLKTGNSSRQVPLHRVLARILRAWVTTGWERYVGRKPTSADPLFPDSAGFRCSREGKAAARLRRALGRANLPKTYQGANITFHSLRRTFGTLLLEAGVDERLRLRLMGQAAGSVNAHYTATELRTLHAAIERIDVNVSAGQVVQLPLRAV